jgi:hypothetical protein
MSDATGHHRTRSRRPVHEAGVITITTRATARTRPTTRPRRAAATGRARVADRATYWRRRIVVGVAAVALVLVMAQAGAALGGTSLAAPGRRPPGQAQEAVRTVAADRAPVTVVRAGDSLWTVAERLVPGADPRPVVDALAEARHGATLTPGETIRWDG